MATILGSKKGIAFIWLGMLVIMLIIGSFYIVLNEPMQIIKELTIDNITGTQYETPYNQANTVWDYFLVIFVFMSMAFLVLSAIRRPR